MIEYLFLGVIILALLIIALLGWLCTSEEQRAREDEACITREKRR